MVRDSDVATLMFSRILLVVIGLLASWPLAAQISATAPSRTEDDEPPVLDLDFRKSWPLPANATFDRGGVSLRDWNCGTTRILTTWSSSQPAFPVCDAVTGRVLGYSAWGQMTANNARSRDGTFWTKVGMTAALNQTGIDGAANSATRFTSTATNGRACINGGASAFQRVMSMHLRRASGTGTVEISMDAVSWTDVTDMIVSTGWRRVPPRGLTQSVAGPQVCLRLGTAGDQVDMDFANIIVDSNNWNVGPSPPILTTTASGVVRYADMLSFDLTKLRFDRDRFVVVVQGILPTLTNASPSLNRMLAQIDDGQVSVNDAIYIRTQTDPPPLPACYTAGVAPGCPDVNVSSFVGGISAPSGGKARCSTIPRTEANHFAGLVIPGQGTLVTVVVAYDRRRAGAALTIVCNNGAGSGNVNLPDYGAEPGFALGFAKRLTVGNSPHGLSGPLNGYVARVILMSGTVNTAQRWLARVAPTSAGTRTPTYFVLDDGTRLKWNSGKRVECNAC